MKLDLNKPIAIYDYNEKATMQAANGHTFLGPVVDRDRILMTTHCSVLNLTHQGTKLSIGKRDAAGRDHFIKTIEAPNAYQVTIAGHIMLEEGERPLGVVEGAANGDELFCTFHGHIYKMD